ncbi:uncharacterized protein [Magallana gigas]|uniref:uncharacterized protein isoform X1 n=1 Tax=Magallana gigas TaxID=29159 RepID=UPI00334067A5
MKVSFLCTLLSCISHGLLVDTQHIDYYAVLGVRRTAGHDEVRSSYKALMLELHPDRNRQDLLANEKSAMINEAYHTLRDEYRRAQYDREHQSAGKWEGTYGQFTYNYFKRDAGYEQFACNYLKRYATYIWKFVVKGGETEETSGDLGVFLAFTATFVYRSPAVMFLLLWVVVENKPHLFLMIWISAKLKKLETKYLQYLAFLWIIYIFIIRYIHESLTSDFSSRIFLFLFNYPKLFVFYFISTVIATFVFFWRYKPHQNQQIKLTIFGLQHGIAFLHLSETMEGETSYLDVLIAQLIFVAISEILWIMLFKHVESLIKSDASKLYTFCKVRCRRIANFLLSCIQQFGARLNNLIRRLRFHVESLPNFARMYDVTAIAVATLYNNSINMCCTVFHCIFNIRHRIANFLLSCIQQFGARLNNLIRRLRFHVESLPNFARIYDVTAIALVTLYNKTINGCCTVFYCIFNISHRRSANEAHERRLLTNVEYILEGRFHTREQLNLLRQNCQRMPVMKTWHVAGALSNTHRLAGFVLGEDHVTLTEREEHERSSTIYPVRTDEDPEDL